MMTLKSNKRVPLGQVVITQGARDVLPVIDVERGLARHAAGDWGEIRKEDWVTNDATLQQDVRVQSSYRTRKGVSFWIITEWTPSKTYVLLPEEFPEE